MKSFLQYISKSELKETKDPIKTSSLIDKSAEAESRDKGYVDLALGALGLDRPAHLEREKEKAIYDWSKNIGPRSNPIVSPYSKVRAAQQNQKELATKINTENKTGILEPGTLHQAETELQRIGAPEFKQIYGKDQTLMNWLNSRSTN